MSSVRSVFPIVLGLSLLAPFRAQAAEARIITFEEAVRIALEQNASVRQAENASRLGAVNVRQARSQFLPDLSLTTRGGQSFGRTFNADEGRIIEQTTDTLNVGVSSGVTLFDGFANTASVREARFNAAASDLDLERTRETIVFTVAANFLELVQQQEQLRVQRENLTAQSELERQISSYVDAGARTIADLYQQQANVASARLSVVQGERAAQLAEVDLMETLQLDPGGAYQFEAAPADASAQDLPSLEAMLTTAYAHRADLEAEERRVAAAEQGMTIARSGRWPTVALTAGYGTSYTSASDFGIGDQFDQRRGGSVGLGFTIPLFDRGATSASIRRAEIEADNARLALESRRTEVGLDVRRAHLDYAAAREQVSAADAQLRAAQLAVQAVEERYAAGAATLVELSQARATHVEAASAQVTARSNLLFQKTLAAYYTGELDSPPDA
jgi:outer membrane protein